MGFFLFCRNAERSDQLSQEAQAEMLKATCPADVFLQDPCVRDYILTIYTLGAKGDNASRHLDHTPLSLHRWGTTSYILVTPNHGVLKLIKPKYAHNETVKTHTRLYGNLDLANIAHVPKVHAAGDNYICMDFISGPTCERSSTSIWSMEHRGTNPAREHGFNGRNAFCWTYATNCRFVLVRVTFTQISLLIISLSKGSIRRGNRTTVTCT